MNLRSFKKERVQNLRSRLKEVATSAILEAAEEVFADLGLDAKMEMIAARAGVSVGTLYNHFADRETLLDSLTKSRRDRIFAMVQQSIDDSSELSFRETLVNLLVAVCDVTGTQAKFRRRLMESQNVVGKPKHREHLEFFRNVLEPAFAKARKAGVLAPDPHKIQVIMFLGMLHALLHNLDETNRLPLKPIAEAAVDSYLNGVTKS